LPRKPLSTKWNSGGFREGEIPVPIPNTEVKTLIANGTIWFAIWESRTLPGCHYQSKRKKPRKRLFLYLVLKNEKRVWESRTRESPIATAEGDEAGLALTEPRVDRLSLSILNKKASQEAFSIPCPNKSKKELGE
jgi:hypothetical protein